MPVKLIKSLGEIKEPASTPRLGAGTGCVRAVPGRKAVTAGGCGCAAYLACSMPATMASNACSTPTPDMALASRKGNPWESARACEKEQGYSPPRLFAACEATGPGVYRHNHPRTQAYAHTPTCPFRQSTQARAPDPRWWVSPCGRRWARQRRHSRTCCPPAVELLSAVHGVLPLRAIHPRGQKMSAAQDAQLLCLGRVCLTLSVCSGGESWRNPTRFQWHMGRWGAGAALTLFVTSYTIMIPSAPR